MTAAAGFARLLANLRELDRVALALSGGVDSGFLLFAAREALGARVLALTLAAPYTPKADVAGAEALARSLGVRHRVIPVTMPPELALNPPDRCYLCKKALFGRLLAEAGQEAFSVLVDGANADDLLDYRPGMRALKELGVRSPLLDAGLGKTAIRTLAEQNGLPVWNRPASACLLTRLPHGTAVDLPLLARIDQAETALHRLGFPAARARCHEGGDLVRIELPPADLSRFCTPALREEAAQQLAALGFRFNSLDLQGYRMGAFNAAGGVNGGDSANMEF